MIKTVLFDLDGVLVDACDWHYEAFNRSLDQVVGYKIPYTDHIQRFNGLPTNKKLDILESDGIILPIHRHIVWDLKQQYTIDVIKERAIVDESKIALHKYLCDNRYRVGCVTNSIRKTAELMLELTGQLQYIKTIISNEDVKNPKPHPEPYIIAMDKLGSFPFECIAIEDSPKGIESANKAYIHVLEVTCAKDVTLEKVCHFIEEKS